MSNSSSLIIGTGIYALAKILGYSWWCGVGLKRLRSDLNAIQRKPLAVKLGMIRFGIGFVVGIPMTAVFGALLNANWFFLPLSYLLTYVPVRWFEWGVMVWWINPATRSWHQLLCSNGKIERIWRLQGIILSCALDLVFFICMAAGLKGMGRIFC